MEHTYKVFARSVSIVFVEVEAKDPDEAFEKANAMDGGDFENDPSQGYFEITEVQLKDE